MLGPLYAGLCLQGPDFSPKRLGSVRQGAQHMFSLRLKMWMFAGNGSQVGPRLQRKSCRASHSHAAPHPSAS
jgi:hypothetical protein